MIDDELRRALEATKLVCGRLPRGSAAFPPLEYDVTGYYGRFVLSRIVEHSPVRGPLQLAAVIGFEGEKKVLLCRFFDELRAAGFLRAPVDTGTDSWELTYLGDELVVTSPPTLLPLLLRET